MSMAHEMLACKVACLALSLAALEVELELTSAALA